MRKDFLDRDLLTHKVIGCAVEVHKHLGPGLLESSYERCLLQELESVGIDAESQVSLPIVYKGLNLESGYRLDIIVSNCLIIELKAVDELAPIHTAELLTYLKLSDVKTGLLINFNTARLADGIKRVSL
jgi:GxxExxY protein